MPPPELLVEILLAGKLRVVYKLFFSILKLLVLCVNIIVLLLTEKWKLTYTSQIDLITNEIISHNMYFYRPLHCWEFNFSYWPRGLSSGFSLEIKVKNPKLQDIKVLSSDANSSFYSRK